MKNQNVYWGKPLLGLQGAVSGCRKRIFDTLRMKAELKFPFHSVHQFLEKWPIQREETLNRLIFRPGIDRGSNILLLLGPAKPVLRIADERAKALSYFPGVCRQSEPALGAPRSGFPQAPFRKRRIRDKGKQFSYGIIMAITTQKCVMVFS